MSDERKLEPYEPLALKDSDSKMKEHCNKIGDEV
jgi:hypothetical protein